ncbi:MAG: ATP-grasp domain-containing protein [Schleiferilactobacillus perolens]|jgi:5-(carboxyamino)imidazole ribonucleotide synthase|uniref:Phosphoribosylaminoimidazole carboxylase NCAIR mutase subunit n=1 Tax=Schleiferilactobacillus perolens DSM 12744 TaxID=1423792 RepID=A0A0R1N7G8_9LACO|nr:ATP-grasp domain-containing protein [Schleiferilactobacillus perolens]KRL12232.1 phosphoribosylaminoimidazole carboxylase NCAIR mutase subunit [Schleiferilactobacillus perolens DSM 12744]MCI1891902.1 ATP-grasp domain-containing protein [Schleiferilactobacillus harbinensis]MCI1911881.1 ATP-grasp domain-containing protein [Schleiferilactobacillus harbinensis]
MTFIAPNQTIGIIGGGIDSYTLTLAARQMGLHPAVLTATATDPALAAADFALFGDLTNPLPFSDLADMSQVIVYADENINSDLLANMTDRQHLPQGTDILNITQDRYMEKVFFEDQNLNTAPYAMVVNLDDVRREIESIGYPAVLKPTQKGLGPKKQRILYNENDVEAAADYFDGATAILESWVPKTKELSVVVVKTSTGETTVYPTIENIYSQNHQLQASILPARIDAETNQEIRRIAKVLADKLHYVGVFGVTYFLTAAGVLYVARVFPGPRGNANVLEYTTGYSAYELHMRAVCDWSIPEPKLDRAGVTVTISPATLAKAIQLIRTQPNTHFSFYPQRGDLPDDAPIGFASFTAWELETVIARVEALGIWHVEDKEKKSDD